MNEKRTGRSILMPLAAGTAVVAVVGISIYLWTHRGEPKGPPDKNPPVAPGPVKPPTPPQEDAPNTQLVRHDGPPVSLSESLEFLHAGQDAVQKDMDPKYLDMKRTGALRGLVYHDEKQPLGGVKISIQNTPRAGVGSSRVDGSYDMVVNGGGLLTVQFNKEEYLPMWRQASVPWQDYAWVPAVVMTKKDSKATSIKPDSDKLQVARANPVEDKDGNRQTTLVFQKGTTAVLEMPDGTKKPLDAMTVRATEYTIGDKGPRRMPAPLPANSAYTYCVELNVDEAKDAGTVRFNQPVYHYLENFLGFPVGIPVPAGYFDTAKGAWVASESGRVIKILTIVKGMADVDVEGKEKPADEAALKALNLSTEERQELARLYKPGTTLWRVPIPHFSTWDLNWGFSPPADAIPPAAHIPPAPHIPPAHKPRRERIVIAEIAWPAHYHEDRTPGAIPPRSIRIPVSGKEIPKSLKRIVIEIYVAGRLIEVVLEARPDQDHIFTWDGKDCHSRHVRGAQPCRVRIGYVYDGVYERVERFGANGNGMVITGSRTRQEVVLWQQHETVFEVFDARVLGMGGWSFEVQHAYDPAGRILYLGNGERHKAGAAQVGNLAITTVAGGGTKEDLGDGGPAVGARIDNPKMAPSPYDGLSYPRTARGLVVRHDGVIFIADENGRIRRVDLNGKITTVAGGGSKDASTGPATELKLSSGRNNVALGPDGSLYISEFGNAIARIRRLLPDGTLTLVAGGNRTGFAGDGGPALKAQLDSPEGLVVAGDGSIYFADSNNHCIRRVTTDGIITTIAGQGRAAGYSGDGGPALKAKLYLLTALAFGPDGSLFFSDQGNCVIRKIDTAGIITTVVGTQQKWTDAVFGGDGGPALKAKLAEPMGLVIGADGSLYMADTKNHRIRHVGPDGIIRTIAGAEAKKEGDFGGDNGPALNAKLSFPTALAFGPDGSLYFYDGSYQAGKPVTEGKDKANVRARIRRISPPMPGFTDTQIAVPSPDGKELFKFSSVGQHLETLDAKDNALRLRFDYDSSGRLRSIEDMAAKATTQIERDDSGTPQAVIAPKGAKTKVAVNTDGYLKSVTAPTNERTVMVYADGGLLKELTRGGAREDKEGKDNQ